MVSIQEEQIPICDSIELQALTAQRCLDEGETGYLP